MLEVIDNQNAPEIFASEVAGYTIAGGNLSLTLASTRATWAEGVITNKRFIVGRIILPLGAASIMSVELFDFLKKHSVRTPGTTEIQ